MADDDVEGRLKSILTADSLLAIYDLNFSDHKGIVLTGTQAAAGFMPNPDHDQKFYDLIFHPILIPLSKIPLATLLEVDLTATNLPRPEAEDYPEQCLGLITILDQTRVLTGGSYNARYTRCFFDPICEKLARQLIALPANLRPDGKEAWLSRGYTYEQYLARVLMIWAPLIHSDNFMVNDRQSVKDFLHRQRAEVEINYAVSDPFAPLEEPDDVDLTLFPKMIAEGPPSRPLFSSDPSHTLPIHDYAFWWIRILNAHFALTDYCGHYPYANEWHGIELMERDKEYLEKTGYALYNPALKPVFEQVKRDVKEGVWQPLQPVERFEKR